MKNNWNRLVLRAPEEEYSTSGGGAADVLALDVDPYAEFSDDYSGVPAEEPAQEVETSEVSSAPATAQTPAETMVPLSAMRELMALQQQQPAQQPVQLTQEQIDERLKVVKVDQQLADAFFGEGATPEQIKVLQGFADMIVTHVDTKSALIHQATLQDVNSRYSPIVEQMEKQKIATFQTELANVYPALKGREALVGQVIQHMKARGFQAATGEEAARAVAAQTEQLIKTIDPNFTLAVQAEQRQQQTQMPTMAGMSAGAGGTASAGGTTKGQPAWRGVFE